MNVNNKAEEDFDAIANVYDDKLHTTLHLGKGFDLALFAEYKVDIFRKKIAAHDISTLLEFGCGTGRNMSFLKKHFPTVELYGCDVSEKSLAVAQKANTAVTFDKIEQPDDLIGLYSGKIDCVFITNVFHHIPFVEHLSWMKAINELLMDKGHVIIFEHNPYNPVTKYIFNHNDEDAGGGYVEPIILP